MQVTIFAPYTLGSDFKLMDRLAGGGAVAILLAYASVRDVQQRRLSAASETVAFEISNPHVCMLRVSVLVHALPTAGARVRAYFFLSFLRQV